MKLTMEQDINALNNAYAQQNRAIYKQHGLCVINILGSPGAGKTTLLEQLLPVLGLKTAVIEGDLSTARDAERISAQGVQVVQINTDGGCHLEAKMIHTVLPLFDLADVDLLLIENVGNLVCPASFDLGEDFRLVVLSLAEGGDKPVKYPATFMSADAVVLSKVDLAPYLDVDIAAIKQDIAGLQPRAQVFETACRREQIAGIAELAAYVRALVAQKRGQA